MALMSVLLVLMLMSALLVGYFAMIAADQQSAGVDRDQTQAYAAAHAGLEKLTADLGLLFMGGNYSPTTTQISALTSNPPTVTGFQYTSPDGSSGYTITAKPVQTATIASGAFQGLVGLITPYEINVTARANSTGGAEVRMRRTLQTVAIPVFQFGVFSELNLNFAAAPSFAFGGRIHTNQNLYLAHQTGATLTLEDKVTAVGEIVRTHLSNAYALNTGSNGYNGTVRVAKAAGTYVNLTWSPNQGSIRFTGAAVIPPSTLQMVGDPPVPTMVLASGVVANETWKDISQGTYNGWIKNGKTGAKRLDLPLVSDGAAPIDIIRRPAPGTADNDNIKKQRFYHLASVRILLSDRSADLTNLQGVTATDPVDLYRLATDAAYRTTLGFAWNNNIPLARAGVYYSDTTGVNAGRGYRIPQNQPIHTGFLKIERQDNDGVWHDVTVEILNLGFTERSLAAGTWNTASTSTCSSTDPSPNAVIRFQRVRDNPPSGYSCGYSSSLGWNTSPDTYIPLALYDSREGARRDDQRTVVNGGVSDSTPYIGGVMHYIELDVYNLKRWLTGAIGSTGNSNTMNVTGYVLYFSDRRGNKNLGANNVADSMAGSDGILNTADDFGDDQETGEYGFEDVVNPATSTSLSNGVLDQGEDINGNGVLDVYGGVPRPRPGVAATVYPWGGYESSGVVATPMSRIPTSGNNNSLLASTELRVNPPLFFRRALKVVNGGYTSGVLRIPANGSQGLSIASENPLYVQGDYNAPNAAGNGWGTTAGTDHVSAAMIADAVTLLSSNWNDISSFAYPHAVGSRDSASANWYRFAIVSGKGIDFPRPNNNSNDDTDYGTDGGVNNFIRFMEDWGGRTANYVGSLVSFYYNRQGVGTYKCCEVVFAPPTRNYRFDTEFLTPSLLPPRTPMFRDVNTLTFRQILRPNQ